MSQSIHITKIHSSVLSPKQTAFLARLTRTQNSHNYHNSHSQLPPPHSKIKSTWQSGFTLVEIMVVVVVLAVFASVVAVSAGNSESRKNRAYYEYLLDSMDYIRLISAERMQPIGIRLITNQQGQIVPEVVRLENAYSPYQQSLSNNPQYRSKNNMELSAQIRNNTDPANQELKQPNWTPDDSLNFPELPTNLTIEIIPLSKPNGREPQPWFRNQSSPQVIWYGTGQASPVNIEIKQNGRLVGEVIQIRPDGSSKVN